MTFVGAPFLACESGSDDPPGPIGGSSDSIVDANGDGDGGATDAGSIDADPMPDSPPDPEPDAPVG